MRLVAVVSALFGLAFALPAAAQQDSAAERAAVHLLQRATFGVRSADVAALLVEGRTAWLERQLHPERIDDGALAVRLEKFPKITEGMGELLRDFQRAQLERRQALQRQSMDSLSDARRQELVDSVRRATLQNMAPEERRARLMDSPQNLLDELVNAKIARAVYSERQLEEMMTDFWFNHFNVFFGKGQARYMIADYERNAIRPHVFGRFRTMLEATARHPAMLFYLDNATSVVPDSMKSDRQRRVGNLAGNSNGSRQRGLNENYARELMELHTLGVDGGYTQKDVIEVARAFTGWQFTRPNQRGGPDVEFVFRMQLHDQGRKTVLGRTLPAGRGLEDGRDVLDILARHPSTANFIAKKLVERFASDQPDPAFVAEIAAVFQKTDGDLRAVTRALFSSARFYEAKNQRSKVKTPFELVASALRVTGADVGRSRTAVQTLRSLGHLPYNEPAPTGFPAASVDWVNSGAMLNRMNFALALAANRLDGVRLDVRALTTEAAPASVAAWVPVMLGRLMPGVSTATLQSTILRELDRAAEPATPDTALRERRNARNAAAPVRVAAGRALGLALGSPDFQRK